MHAYIHSYIHTYVHHVHAYTHMHACMHTYININRYIYTYMCIYIHVHADLSGRASLLVGFGLGAKTKKHRGQEKERLAREREDLWAKDGSAVGSRVEGPYLI